METITEMETRHRREMEELRKDCLHEDIFDWIPHAWTPGHTYLCVRICNRCGAIVEEKQVEVIAAGEPVTTYLQRIG